MTEHGVFNDEGCIDRGFYSLKDAEAAVREYRKDGDEHVHAAVLCGEHDEQPADSCEECWAEDEYDDDEI